MNSRIWGNQHNEVSEEANHNDNSIESVKVKDKNEIKWIDNDDNEIEQVFGFNENAELVNSRAAMMGFIKLILTELAFGGDPVSLAIFGIN